MSVATADVLTFSLRGRVARPAYVAGVFLALASAAVAGTMFAAGTQLPSAALASALTAFSVLFGLAAAGLLVSSVVRRLHDISYGGFAALVLLVPLANVVCLAILAFVPGKRGANRFGPAPRTSAERDAGEDDEPNVSAVPPSDVVDISDATDDPSGVETSPAADAVPLLTSGPTAMNDTSRTAAPVCSNAGSNARSNTRSGARSPAKPNLKTHPNSKPKAPSIAEPVEVVDEAEARCERVWEAARVAVDDENLSVRLQVKVRSVDKLRKLLDKGRITSEHFKRWKLRIMEL